jgi:very-short-patch-repair endonuclease
MTKISEKLKIALTYKNKAAVIGKNKVLLSELTALTPSCDESASIAERIYILNGGKKPKCKNGMDFKWNPQTNKYDRMCGRSQTCECYRNSVPNKIKEGHLNRSQEEINNSTKKRKQTVFNENGVEFIAQLPEIQLKIKQTHKAKTGHEHPLSNPEIRQKQQQTHIDKTGFTVAQDPEVIKKRKNTNLEKYGHEYGNVQAIKQTMIERYGSEHALQVFDSKLKRVNTMHERYNFPFSRSHSYSEQDYKLFFDKNFLLEQYNLYGISGILKKFNVSREMILRYLRYHDINIPYNFTIIEETIYQLLLKWVNPDEIKVQIRSVIKPYELDFYIPSKNIAIEVCGLFWHSEKAGRDKHYHKNKLELCNNQNIRLITIFEDEIEKSFNQVENRLEYIFNMVKRKYHTRKLTIKEIDSKTAKQFLNDNHINGYVGSAIKLGAFNNDELVSVMTFGSLRVALGSKNKIDKQFELLRFATNGNFPGVASKLLKFFIKNHNPDTIVSYCDLRWGNGKVYSKMNMVCVSNGSPNYWYFDPKTNTRKHRYNFTKHKLVAEGFDPNKSEWEIMQERGYDRIWDCGHSKWVWNQTK